MTRITESIAKAVDAHATELILFMWAVVVLIAYCVKPLPELLGILSGAAAALYAIAQKRPKTEVAAQIENADQVKVNSRDQVTMN
jgi:hypothetical protein